MIASLTKEQEARFPEFVEKWTAIGLATDKLDRMAIKETIARLFKGQKTTPKSIFCHSPLESTLIISVLRNSNVIDNVSDNVSDNVLADVSANVIDNVSANVRDNVRANVVANVRDNVSDNVSDNVRANVIANVRDNVSDNVRANVVANVSDNVRANVVANVRDNVSDNVSANVRDNVRANVRDLFNFWYDFGQFAAYWLSYYDFANEILGVSNEKLKPNEDLCRQAGWSFLFWEYAFICEKPVSIFRNSSRQLHKDGAAALEYSDGFGIYALNGIRMKSEYVLTPAEKIQPQIILKEENADIRRELIRKVGIDRVLAVLPHKKIDSIGNYELLNVNLSAEVPNARFLKMLNPSIGVFHVEGVDPSCDTVEKCLNWRNQNRFTNAEILT